MYETNYLEYIFIIINVLAIIGIIYYLYFLYFKDQFIDILKREPIIENLSIDDIRIPPPPSLDDIKNKLEGPFREIKDKFSEAGDRMKDGINSTIDEVKNKVLGPLDDIFNKAGLAFTEVPRRFSMFGSAFGHIFDGIGEEVTGVFDGIGVGFKNIGELFEYSGIFIFMYLSCGVKLIGNLHKCMFYYCLQASGQIFYLPMRIILWFFYKIGIDLYSIEKYVWDGLEWLDGNFHKNTGLHFMHFTLSVRNDCYNCRRMKKQTLTRKAKDIDDDFRVGVKRRLNKGVDTLQRAGDEFKGAFM